jgi:uncharacterized protein YndB with AHSA1/START domain
MVNDKMRGQRVSVRRENGFSVTTSIKASPQELYRAWTDSAGVEGWLATHAEVDARVGGRYVYRWPSPEGELSARGRYIELIPERRIVQSWESWGPDGQYADGDALLTVEFIDAGDGSTDMTQTESSDAYSDQGRIDMSISGTVEVHAALKRLIEARGLQ